MSVLEAGLPAFPSRHSHEHFEYAETAYLGMTLRDYFAAKAMAIVTPSGYPKDDAHAAYAIADAMLAARSKP